MSEDDEVGYKKPPKKTQFKKGRSGNPKGRPKGRRNFSTDLKATLNERVRVNKGGKRKTVSTQLAMFMRLREQALSGDPRALDRYIELARTYNDEEIAEATKLSSTDAEILDAYKARVLQRARKPPPGENAVNDNNDSPQEEEDDDAWLD